MLDCLQLPHTCLNNTALILRTLTLAPASTSRHHPAAALLQAMLDYLQLHRHIPLTYCEAFDAAHASPFMAVNGATATRGTVAALHPGKHTERASNTLMQVTQQAQHCAEAIGCGCVAIYQSWRHRASPKQGAVALMGCRISAGHCKKVSWACSWRTTPWMTAFCTLLAVTPCTQSADTTGTRSPG
jgi:hypothetical protein